MTSENNIVRYLREDSGLTLTELLIVILILGVLSGVSVLTFGNSRSSAVQNSCKSAYSAVELAISSYLTDSPTATIKPSIAQLSPDYLNLNLLESREFTLSLLWSADGSHNVTVTNRNGMSVGNAPGGCSNV